MKGPIKTYVRRIFNTLEIHSYLLDFLVLLVAADIYQNMYPSSFYKPRHIDDILSSKTLIVMILFYDQLAQSQGVLKKYKTVKCKIQNTVYLTIMSLEDTLFNYHS